MSVTLLVSQASGELKAVAAPERLVGVVTGSSSCCDEGPGCAAGGKASRRRVAQVYCMFVTLLVSQATSCRR